MAAADKGSAESRGGQAFEVGDRVQEDARPEVLAESLGIGDSRIRVSSRLHVLRARLRRLARVAAELRLAPEAVAGAGCRGRAEPQRGTRVSKRPRTAPAAFLTEGLVVVARRGPRAAPGAGARIARRARAARSGRPER